MPTILTFLPFYLPGYTSGGPIRTIANLVERLGHEYCFKIITSHADPRDPEPYRSVRIDQWQPVGAADVYYASPASLTLRHMRKLVRDTDHDVVYLNSFFAPHFTVKPLLLRRLELIPERPAIVAPRGELASNALSIKRARKTPYMTAARAWRLYDGVIWQASSVYEEMQVREHFGADARVVVAPDLAEAVSSHILGLPRREKTPGRLRVIFLARIARMKNLDGALRVLAGMGDPIELDVYGPLEDEVYWAECQRQIAALPPNIIVQYKGPVPPEHVRSTMAQYDLFFLPTRGENYGHVILEAMSAGCPVLISDLTPWRSLEPLRVGWDLPIADLEHFRDVLKRCVNMSPETHRAMSDAARRFAHSRMEDEVAIEQNRKLFRSAAETHVRAWAA